MADIPEITLGIDGNGKPLRDNKGLWEKKKHCNMALSQMCWQEHTIVYTMTRKKKLK